MEFTMKFDLPLGTCFGADLPSEIKKLLTSSNRPYLVQIRPEKVFPSSRPALHCSHERHSGTFPPTTFESMTSSMPWNDVNANF